MPSALMVCAGMCGPGAVFEDDFRTSILGESGLRRSSMSQRNLLRSTTKGGRASSVFESHRIAFSPPTKPKWSRRSYLVAPRNGLSGKKLPGRIRHPRVARCDRPRGATATRLPDRSCQRGRPEAGTVFGHLTRTMRESLLISPLRPSAGRPVRPGRTQCQVWWPSRRRDQTAGGGKPLGGAATSPPSQ